MFSAIIPPPFFNNLIATIYSYRTVTPPLTGNDVNAPDTSGRRPQYFAHEIVEWLRVDRVGCVDCRTRRDDGPWADVDDVTSQQSLYHQVLIELLAQSRVVQVTITIHISWLVDVTE